MLPYIINYVRSLKQLNRIHFVSDGPTTQYRSKTNFYLFSKKIYDYGFQEGTWNFWETVTERGHLTELGRW
ncbi:hypothetical protein DPMN_074150 [Dreissena polymorpha]|uniref:Uncharacterized protein n=1 Tax=Dreissena polymorpha TaxID=45954 RepID=A0A9D4BLD4_DREPO|nr:hypothetical protein DPMN_074150 [Dreissena polymorpha]